MNSCVLISTKGMTQEEWLSFRQRGIGGSDVAAIACLSKYKSPASVYLDKLGLLEHQEAGEAAYWGTTLEDLVAKEFSKQTGLKVQRRNAIFQHPEYPFMLANIDRFIIDKEKGKGILECKTASEYLKNDWEGDNLPDAYMLQIQHYLAVTGLDYAYIAVLIGGNKFKYKYVPRDEELIRFIIKIESDFWQMVENKTPPEMDGSSASTELLGLLYPKAEEGTEILLPLDAEELIAKYEQYQAEEKEAAAKKDEAANKLKALLETNEKGKVGERLVSWKSVSSNRFDSTTFKKDHPDLYTKYAKVSESRRFTIK